MDWKKVKHAKDTFMMWLGFACFAACVIAIPFVIRDVATKPAERHKIGVNLLWYIGFAILGGIWKAISNRWFPKKEKKHES